MFHDHLLEKWLQQPLWQKLSYLKFRHNVSKEHKAWFPLHDKCHDHDTKTKRL